MRGYIHDLLRHLGVPRTLVGHQQLVEAVLVVLDDPDHLRAATKEIYMPVGKQFGISSGAVSRNIRTVSNWIWARCPDRLQALAGYPLSARPRPAELVEILYWAVEKRL